MAVAAADDLYDAAVTLLAAASDALAQEAPGGPIALEAIWLGRPSYDCVPMLAVHCGGAAVGDTYPLQPPLQPMQRQAYGDMVDLVSLTITVLRCVPTISQNQQGQLLPNPTAISASAKEGYGDLWAIWNHLKNEHRAGVLFQTPSGRREFIFDPAVPVLTSGGAGGWEIPIRVQLGGYNRPAS